MHQPIDLDRNDTDPADADPMTRFEETVVANLPPERPMDDQIRDWYRDRIPWAKMSGGELGEEFRKWAVETMQAEPTTRPSSHGWAVLALALATQRSVRAAAAACGVSDRTLRRLLSEQPAFAALVELAQQEVVKGVAARRVAIRSDAVEYLHTCLRCGDPRIALRAAALLAAGVGL